MTEDSPLVTDFRAWREGDWILVALDGEVVYRRLTRDRKFTHVWVRFHEYQSPVKPKTRANFAGCELGGNWRTGRNSGLRNAVQVPIRRLRYSKDDLS